MSAEQTLALKLIGADGAARTFRLPHGTTVVGRSADCTITIDDPSLSRRHFEITCDATGCHLRDLNSRNGVMVNSQVRRTATIKPGDRLTAGAVVLEVGVAPDRLSGVQDAASGDRTDQDESPTMIIAHPIFSETAASLDAVAPPGAPGTLLAALAARLDGPAEWRLYAVVDGAAAFELGFTARMMGHELFTLFSGTLADAAAHVGPIVVAVGERSAFLKAWVDKIGTHAGVLLETPVEPAALCAHLRHVFVASDESGQEYFFRFYDPRVLRVFLPTCHPEELREFFGPVLRWVAEDADGTGFDVYTFNGDSLERMSVGASGVPETAQPSSGS